MNFDELARDVESTLRTHLDVTVGDLRLVRQSSNTVFADQVAGIIARVALVGAIERMPSEANLRSLQGFAEAGAPIAAPLVSEVLVLPGGQMMTVWPLLRAASDVDAVEVSETLSQLHDCAIDGEFPVFDLHELAPDYRRFEEAAKALGVPVNAVTDAREAVEPAWQWLSGHLPDQGQVVAHRDPYPDNMAYNASGRLVWIDLDTLCVGPRELDLEKLLKLARRFGASYPRASDEATLLNNYRHDYDPELMDALNVVGDFDSALGAVALWQCVPSEYNGIRAKERVSTLADPLSRWLPF